MTASVKTMEFPMVLLRLTEWLLYPFLAKSCYSAAMKLRNHGFFLKNTRSTSHPFSLYPSLSKLNLHGRESQTLVCDIHGSLLRTPSFFPYFMLVAFEGGSIIRAFLLLLTSPFLLILDYELKIRVMIFVTFCGLRLKDMENVSRAVLPKFYLENLNLHAFEALETVGSIAVVTSVPRVMVEGFLKEYLRVDSVVGTELHTAGRFFTGLLTSSGLVVKHRAVKEMFGDKKADIGIGRANLHDHLLLSLCKEAYVITGDRNGLSCVVPRKRYPKPLVFHDGRLAFLPTPLATLSMFVWFPIGIILSAVRFFAGICLPYNLALFVAAASGVRIVLKGTPPPPPENGKDGCGGGVLYVCTHRTLLDPVFLSTTLGKPLTAVTYSLSRMSELMAPLKTVRLTRDRDRDGETMRRLLREGDLVVCPEGTTCREPYLLRFSSLFAELADEIVPVAMNTEVGMFYGTTASGLKCLDPVFFLMNPRPKYTIHVLEKLPGELTCAGGKSPHEVANYIQRQLGEALGFECTGLTRRDKYLMLAGNEGVVREKREKP